MLGVKDEFAQYHGTVHDIQHHYAVVTFDMVEVKDEFTQYITIHSTVCREFFASGNFGENDACKVCKLFTESYFCYFKDSQWRRMVGFIFRCVYFCDFREVANPAKIKTTQKIPDIL